LIENLLTQIKVTWNEPFDNFDSITAYLIEFRQADDSTFSATAECDGQDNTVISTRTCFVELATFRAAPYFLTFKDLVVVRIRSQNAFGWSLYSQPSTGGAIIQTEPT